MTLKYQTVRIMKRITIVAILNLMACLAFGQVSKESTYKIIDRTASSKAEVVFSLNVHLSDEKAGFSNEVAYTIFDNHNKTFLRSNSDVRGHIYLILHQPKKVKNIMVFQMGYKSLVIPIKELIGSEIKMDIYLQQLALKPH